MKGYEQTVKFIDRHGNILEGTLVHQYSAFEGGMRYIIVTELGKEYRCVKGYNTGEYNEYVA